MIVHMTRILNKIIHMQGLLMLAHGLYKLHDDFLETAIIAYIWGPFADRVNFNPGWIRNYIHYKGWDEITYWFQTPTVHTGIIVNPCD